MSKLISLSFLTLLLSINTQAANNYEGLWDKGHAYFQEQNYDSAAYYYEQIAQQKPHNAEVYYNLGNAYYRLNNVGKAVLNYERALKIKPYHKQASDNLYLTQSRIENRIQKVPEIFFLRWWRSMTQSNLTNIYAVIACIIFLLIALYNIGKRAGYIQINIPAQIPIASVIVCILFIVLSVVSANRLVDRNAAIVMEDKLPLMPGPKYGTSKSLIPEGTKVEICDEQKTWFEVTLPDGRKGWLHQSSVERI